MLCSGARRHYHGNPGALTFPCQQYYHPTLFPAAGGVVQSWPRASDDDDNKFLVDRFEEFERSLKLHACQCSQHSHGHLRANEVAILADSNLFFTVDA